MKTLKASLLILSIGLGIASCNNCTTKDTSKSDSVSTTVSGNTAPATMTAAADTAAPAVANDNSSNAVNAAGGSNTHESGNMKTGSARHSGTKDSIDYSTYTKKSPNKPAAAPPTNNPPKGTFGNSIGQDN